MPQLSVSDLVAGWAPFPVNQWYVAAFASEIANDTLLRRVIASQPIVLARKSDGAVAALLDRCPHRGLPLSMGKKIGLGVIQCGYHGYEFDLAGKCTRIPSQDVIPSSLCVRSFPLVQRWDWIWVWVGDPSRADESLIPDHHALGLLDDAWLSEATDVLLLKANYLVCFENFADSPHVSFCHKGLDQDEVTARSPGNIDLQGSRVRVTRFLDRERPGTRLGQDASAVDRTLTVDSYSNNIVAVDIRVARAGNPDEVMHEARLVYAITPETDSSTHQFIVRNYRRPNLFKDEREDFMQIMNEDRVVVEEIQRTAALVGRAASQEFHGKADLCHIRTREVITRMLNSERGQASSS